MDLLKKIPMLYDKDIIIGKIMPIKNNQYKHRDTSISVKNNEKGYIDSIYINYYVVMQYQLNHTYHKYSK